MKIYCTVEIYKGMFNEIIGASPSYQDALDYYLDLITPLAVEAGAGPEILDDADALFDWYVETYIENPGDTEYLLTEFDL